MTEAISCRDEDVFVVGGANSAGQAAMHLSKYARQVTMLVRGPVLLVPMKARPRLASSPNHVFLHMTPEGKAVHYMCVTSMGEVHDHKGQWKDDKTIEFKPLQSGMMGKLATETMRWSFPDTKTIAKTSMVTMPDGSSMTFEFNGKR